MKQLGNHMTPCNPRWRRAGNLKANIGARQVALKTRGWTHNMNKGYSRPQPYKMQAIGKQGYTVTTSRRETQSHWLVSEKQVESIKLIFLKVALFFHGMHP